MKLLPLLIAACVLMTGCFGMITQPIRDIERQYGMPMREVVARERPKQLAKECTQNEAKTGKQTPRHDVQLTPSNR